MKTGNTKVKRGAAEMRDEAKGEVPGGICARAACDCDDAPWWNRSTHQWYCTACARRINDGAPGLCVLLATGPRSDLTGKTKVVVMKKPGETDEEAGVRARFLQDLFDKDKL